MTYTVTYRERDGAKAEVEIEAASRAVCFAQCRARGIAPMSVREGQTGRCSASQRTAGSQNFQNKRLFIVLIAFGILVLLALGAWWFWGSGETRPSPVPAKPNVPKVANVPNIHKVLQERPTAVSVTTNAPGAKTDTKELSVSVQTNRTVRPRFFKPTSTLEDGTIVDVRPPPVIKDPMERALAAVATPGGLAIPFAAALRRFSKQELMEMLARNVEFAKDDSEAVVEKKVAVQQVKEQFRSFLKAGKTLDEAIWEVDRQMRMENLRQASAYKGLAEAVRTGDAALVNRFVEEQNKVLHEQGLRLLTVPPQFRIEAGESKTTNQE